ncbi:MULTISPECIES: hypothetical protein [unclassified Dysgonomonas]|uniref:hypothetical protein n=1 Tax=unclassified Dysgonomonas TaxID=2630389 RepID=UPI0025C704DE|nr:MULTISPECIES: hypothetical protein [unclassified Dysgonomonas]HMM04688.1 hypothetical protein [Dysgonomonas sp.]
MRIYSYEFRANGNWQRFSQQLSVISKQLVRSKIFAPLRLCVKQNRASANP